MADFDYKEIQALRIVLDAPFRRKKQPKDGGGGRGRAMQRVQAIVRRVPEVMVKVTGRTRGLSQLREHLNYITRNGEVAAVSPEGIVYGRDVVHDLAKTWWAQREVVAGSRRSNSVETVNFILSMPNGTNRDAFMAAAEAFAERAFSGTFDYVIADHRDTAHTHVHLTVRARGKQGARLNPRRDDLSMWREWMAHELRARGIAAEASPRRVRGIVQKPKNQAIKHLDMRGASKVQRDKVHELVRHVTAGTGDEPGPWEPAIYKSQSEVRKAWLALADQFDSEGPTGRGFASEIRRFVDTMPPIKTERDSMRDAVKNSLAARQKTSESPER